MPLSKPVRYLVFNHPDHPPVSYNAALGKDALRLAKITAAQTNGKLVVENSDGTTEILREYCRHYSAN